MTPTADDKRRWLADAIATRDIDRLKPNMAAAGDRVNDARRHVRSARRLADDDPTLAMAACHDAIRKAITAHMAAAGLRPRGGEGAHRIVLDYARHQLSDVISTDDLSEPQRSEKTAPWPSTATSRSDSSTPTMSVPQQTSPIGSSAPSR